MTFGRDFASNSHLEFEQPVFQSTTVIEKSKDIMKINESAFSSFTSFDASSDFSSMAKAVILFLISDF